MKFDANALQKAQKDAYKGTVEFAKTSSELYQDQITKRFLIDVPKDEIKDLLKEPFNYCPK